MSQLHRIGRLKSDPWGDLIFVHGLGGHWFNTWAAAPESRKGFWPAWLARDLPHVNVWSLEYEADPSSWLDSQILDRTNNLLVTLEAEGLGSRPIVFVCHSFGGLLVKQILNIGDTYGVPTWHNIIKHVCAIVFLATPHKGSHLADYLDNINRVLFVASPIRAIRRNEPHLHNLSIWFRNNAKRLRIKILVFYEDMDTTVNRRISLLSARVVDATSSDPEIDGVVPKAVRSDHITIAKPESRRRPLYKLVRQFISDCIANPLEDLLLAAERYGIPREWKRIPFGSIYLAYGGPLKLLHYSQEKVEFSNKHMKVLRRSRLGWNIAWPDQQKDREELGYAKLYETDCRNWYQEIWDRGQFIVMVRPEPECVDLGFLVERLVRRGPTWRLVERGPSWECDVRILPDIQRQSYVACDDRELEEILQDFLDAVSEFIPADTQVRVTMQQSQETVGITFATDGPGVPEEFVKTFWRGTWEAVRDAYRADRNDRKAQLGLQLWSARRKVQSWSGSMTVDNTSVGGLCIRVWFPMCAPPSALDPG